MTKLEDLKYGARVKGILPNGVVSVVDVKWYGTHAIELTYKDSIGRVDNRLLYRDDESLLEIESAGSAWSFDSDGDMMRLVSEAYRIRLAYLFDPYLAVHTSLIEPLPHQITGVYGAMLPRQPLRFLLADDPGAGKTIMAGLFIKELQIRGDLMRCLIVCPGMLIEQWQDELDQKFHLPFKIMTNEDFEAARTGNWFLENDLVICRLDKLSRSEDVQEKIKQTDWDLIIVDEAHKMSASYFGSEVKKTKRYRLGELLAARTRHFLLMTATPHNGKEADFQLFMALLDGDRFEGKFRDGVHVVDTSDLMRRLIKENLLRFNGTPLFPERKAYTVNYKLSDGEALLYKEVTDYVREEFNRADTLENEGRKGTIGFALITLQRRLASSPEAIYQSLKRRKERLEKRLREERLLARGAASALSLPAAVPIDLEDIDEIEDVPNSEIEGLEEEVVDQATAARTIAELEAEIQTLQRLETIALQVRHSGTDKKWDELSKLLQNNNEMFDAYGARRKLVIFTEHRDTLNYISDKIRTLLGRPEEVVIIHGGMGRDERRKMQEAFTQDKDVRILVATDAAGEGINLQRAHLMVNYDLPWNPNRIEQRFGRIHRIGQTEVCHLWNLVAEETRESDVFLTLCKKLEEESGALGGQIFDVLGKAFREIPLHQLLIEAIRYGDKPEIRARLNQVVDKALDRENIRKLVEDNALARETMDFTKVQEIRQRMERADARRLQPHFIESFFKKAFESLGGAFRERETRRYEISHVPAIIRNRDRQIGRGAPILTRYERITFEKDLISIPGKPLASYVCPGHPLLNSTIDIVLERSRELLKKGALFVDPNDDSDEIQALCYLEHSIHDARTDKSGNRRVISRQMQFVLLAGNGSVRMAGPAPYLDYRPATQEERDLIQDQLNASWLQDDIESRAMSYAITEIVPSHLQEVKTAKEELIDKTEAAVKDRLTKEINYWDHRSEELKAQEIAGQKPRLNSVKARQRADELHARLQKRLAELAQERRISASPPVLIGGALVIPADLLARMKGEIPDAQTDPDAFTRKQIEDRAMRAIMETECQLGYEPRDVSSEYCGYDIESAIIGTGRLRFIEVKGRAADQNTITLTKNEILTGLNKPDDYILAIVIVDGENVTSYYIRKPFGREPDFGVTSVNYNTGELLARAGEPA